MVRSVEAAPPLFSLSEPPLSLQRVRRLANHQVMFDSSEDHHHA